MLSQLLYANLTTQLATESLGGSEFTFADFHVGKQYPFALRLSKAIEGTVSEIFPEVRAIRVNVGLDDVRPESGTVRIKIGGGASVPGVNTTAAVDRNISGDELAAKFNQLSGIGSQDFTVELDRGSYLLRRVSGAQITLSVLENRFKPMSFVRVRAWQEDGGGWVSELRFIQSPIAFTDSADPVLPPPPSIKTLQDGATDESGTYLVNEKQRLTIPPEFRGQYRIRSGESVTALLSLDDGEDEIAAALNAMFAPVGGSVKVANVATRVADILFGGSFVGVDQPEMTIEVPEEAAPPGDLFFVLNLNTTEAWAALRSKSEMLFPIDVEIDVPSVDNDAESPSLTIPVFVSEIKIKRALSYEGLATAQPVNWLRKPNPKTYLPYNETQLGIGQLYYEQSIGDGAETEFEIDHNLGVAALTGLRIIDLATGRVLKDSEFEAVSANEGNTLELTFTEAPAATGVLVTVSTPQPIENFINDLAIEIAQVNGLQDFMDSISARVVTLEAILPSTGPGSVSTQASGIDIFLPTTQEVLFFKVSGVTAKDIFTDAGIDASKLPRRAPYMLPACHDSSADTALSDPPQSPSGNAGQVFTAAAKTLIAGGGLIPSSYIEAAGFVGCDGRILFPASHSGTTKSYYPRPFERELWRIFINDQQLRINRTLDVQFGLGLQLVWATSNAQWVLVIEKGTAPQDTAPSTTGTNLQNIVWDAAPILSQRLILTPLQQSHSFGARIKRSLVASVDTISLDTMLYGVWGGNNAAAPASANFALRARLINFDTENAAASDARGWVSYQIISAEGYDDAGKGGKAKATIS